MRMIYQEGEEAAFERAKERLLEKFAAWANERAPEADMFTVSTAIDYRFTDMDGRLGLWTAGELEEFLLAWFPRKVSVRMSELSNVVPAIRAWITFLDESKLLDRHGDGIDALERALRMIEPEFPAAMADKSRWGMAKSFVMSAFDAGVDVEDDRALDRFMQSYNAGLADMSDDSEILEHEIVAFRPIRLPADDELVRMAAESPVVRAVRTLADWAGSGRCLTEARQLTDADQAELTELCRASDVPGELLSVIPEWAKAAGIVRTVKGKLLPVKKQRKVLDRPLELWDRLFETLFGLGETIGAPYFATEARYDVDECLTRMLAEAYARGHPAKAGELTGTAWQHLKDEHYYPADQRASVLGDLHQSLRLAEQVGALTMRGDPGDLELDLTPLGLRGLNRVMRTIGISAPVFGELRDADAETLCAALGEYDKEDIAEEFAEWLARRDAQAAVGQLAQVVQTTDAPGARITAVDLLTRVAPEGFDALAELVDHPVAGPVVKIRLIAAGRLDPRGLSRDELLYGVVDTLAALGEISGEDLIAAFATFGADQAETVAELWRVPHPATGQVLEEVSAHHPDKKVAKSARKALFKLRSRR